MGALGMPLSGGILVPTCAIYSSTEGPASRPARLLGVRVENRAAALTLTNQPTNYLYMYSTILLRRASQSPYNK